MPFNWQEAIGVGDSQKNNGILFLIATGDRELRIEVGNGLEGAIPDGKAGRILDNYVIPSLRNDEWDAGIKNGFNAILEEVCKEYSIEIDGSIAATPLSSGTELSEGESAAFGLSFLLLVISIIARFKVKNKGAFALGAITISTALQCVIAGGISLLIMYLIMNIMIVIFSMFGHFSGGSYYGGGFHGGGYHGGRWTEVHTVVAVTLAVDGASRRF